jgi:hypothetical protein
MVTPAATLLAARRTSMASEYEIAATTFPRKNWARVHDRVRIWAQVPKWSSLEKMSPATSDAKRGRTHCPQKPSTTIGTAKPDEWTHWPNRVS